METPISALKFSLLHSYFIFEPILQTPAAPTFSAQEMKKLLHFCAEGKTIPSCAEKTLSLRLKPRCALPSLPRYLITKFYSRSLRSGRQTGVYRNFTRLVKFPNVNSALKHSEIFDFWCPENFVFVGISQL